MIDVHLHLLPGVDDGPPDLKAALALAHECCAADLSEVVATPHVNDWTRSVLPDAAAVQAQVTRLQAELHRAGIPLQVLAGGETFLSPDLPRLVREGVVPTIAGTHWLLIETPIDHKPFYLEHVFFELLTMGITPLLAHPERYAWLYKNPDLLGELVRRGARAQVTAASLTSRRKSPQHALAATLVQRGFVQVIATDRHKAGNGSSLRDAFTAAEALVGEKRAWDLVETHPRLIVEDHPIPVALEDPAPRRGWITRWFQRSHG